MTKTGKYILATMGAILAYNLLRGQSSGEDVPDMSFLDADCDTPRGIRNNNPGNLKFSSSPWLGKLPYDANQDYDCRTGRVTRTFEQFSQYKYGIRALIKLLQNYMEVKNLRTISQIVNRYAPSTENNPVTYIQFVANYTGFDPNWPLSPSRETLRALSRAIAKYENGVEAVSDGQFAAVWNEFFADTITGHYLGFPGCEHEICRNCGGIVPGVAGLMDICHPRCLSAHENSPCECKCGGRFHANPNRLARLMEERKKKASLAIGAIIDPEELPDYTTLCKDGTYSRSTAPNACTYHGGVKQYGASPPGAGGQRAMEAHPSAVYLIPLEDISFDRPLFQNREEEYSEESVQRIISAVEDGSFRFEVFDPILLWKAPGGRLVVLSGHSRTEAFTRLAAMGYNEFRRIPAKIIEATQAQARRIALESNTLATRETDSERAAYYRALRDQEGLSPADVDEMAKQNEGSNARRIIAYSYLNPRGKAFATLKAMEGRDDTSQENIKNVANWIGTARQRFPELSNMHEDELYNWLIGGAFGRQYTNMRDFLHKVQSVIYQRTEFGRFNPDTPLNIANLATPTFGEAQYNAQLADLKKQVRELDNKYQDTLKELNATDIPQATREQILNRLEMQLRTARQKLVDFTQRATKPGAAARSELNLFAVSGHRHRKIMYL